MTQLTCMICNCQYPNYRYLSNHIKRDHNITSKEYHDYILHTDNICKNKNCNNKTSFKNLNIGYLSYCSNSCNIEHNGLTNIRKMNDVVVEKYNVANIAKSKHHRLIVEKTNIKRYGGTAPICSNDIKEKIKDTNISKYGVDNPFKSNDIKTKIKDTNTFKYGVDNPFKSNDIKEKIKDTNNIKYGVDNPQQNADIRDKTTKTNIKLYGAVSPTKNDIVRQKISITNRLRYITKEKYEIYNRMLSNDKFTILFTFDEMDYVKTNYKIKCNNCNHEFYRYFDDFLLQFKCPNCNIGSSIENKIKELLDSNNINYIINNRTIISPYELDFYLPEYNIAIECHGLYWHSETILQNRNIYARTYHLLKHDLCKSEGIQLLQFFEDEIVNRFDIISNIILAKCNKLKMLCGARKCEIREITNSQSNHILKYNHIHNSSNSKFQIGAYYKNELVAVMTFKDYAISRSNNGNMELDRFCTINGYYIPGIASRLFKYFINNNENCNISTYADLRFSNGNLYDKLGFKFIHQSKPSYSYIINKERKHRFTYRKSILKTKLLKFDETVTGYQNMINNGYDRIWDCGHLKYEYKKD